MLRDATGRVLLPNDPAPSCSTSDLGILCLRAAASSSYLCAKQRQTLRDTKVMSDASDTSDTSDIDEVGENVITERLTIIATMVAGDFSSVVAARRQSDNRIYCVKAFRRDMMPAPDLNETDTPLAFRVLRELRGNQTASQLPHPFISQSLFAFKSEQHLLLGMDRAGADDFFTYLMTRVRHHLKYQPMPRTRYL